MARTANTMNERQLLSQKEKAGRSNLLIAIILTVVNIVLFLVGSETMLLFSISVPYYAVIFGSIFAAELGAPEMLVTGCVIAGVILAVYFLCWLLSKNRLGWLVAAMILVIIDTLALVAFYLLAGEISGVLDLVFHAMILYYLIVGIRSSKKLKTLPPEEPWTAEPAQYNVNSTALRRIEPGEKCRILLEHTYGTYRIVYRRVKKTNQLVINDYIYDELTFGIEPEHSLSARLDGHEITVGYKSVSSRSYLIVDGKEIVRKIRWY